MANSHLTVPRSLVPYFFCQAGKYLRAACFGRQLHHSGTERRRRRDRGTLDKTFIKAPQRQHSSHRGERERPPPPTFPEKGGGRRKHFSLSGGGKEGQREQIGLIPQYCKALWNGHQGAARERSTTYRAPSLEKH